MTERNIETTRGDMLPISIGLEDILDQAVEYKTGDIIRFRIIEKKNTANVVLQRDFTVTNDTEDFYFEVSGDDMKIGDLINKPTDYWYEIELNPDTPNRCTIVGFTNKKSGPAILTLLPEGGDKQ